MNLVLCIYILMPHAVWLKTAAPRARANIELDYKESWVPKNWGFWTVVLVKTLGSPSDWRKIKPVNPKGNQSWIHFKDQCWSWNSNTSATWYKELTHWKDPDAGQDWRQEEKVTTEDEMVGWHHRLEGHEFEQAPGVGDGQGSLACCCSWGSKESDMTEQMNWTLYVLSEIYFKIKSGKILSFYLAEILTEMVLR